MHRSLMWLVGGGLVLSAPLFTSAASRTSSSLENASWIESVVLTSSDSSLSRDGVDDAVPEPLTASVAGAGYSLDGQVVFPLFDYGAPNVTITLGAQHESGLALIGSLAGCRINFQFRVLESATPWSHRRRKSSRRNGVVHRSDVCPGDRSRGDHPRYLGGIS